MAHAPINADATDSMRPLSRQWHEHRFVQFYEKTFPQVWRYVAGTLGRADVADDIVQEAYIRLLRTSLPPMDEDQARSYLFRIATRLVYDLWRKEQRERRFLRRWRLERRPAKPEPEGDDLDRVLRTLSVQDRTLLWLAYVEGLSHREIAEVTGRRERSIRVLLFRARRRLLQAMRKGGWEVFE